MRRLVVVVALAGCSGAGAKGKQTQVDEPPAMPDATPVEPYVLPLAEAPPAYTVECVDFGTPKKPKPKKKKGKPPAPSGASMTKHYVFDALSLPVGVRVPVTAERPRRSWDRSPTMVHDVIARRGAELDACWAWAQAALGLGDTRVELGFRIDPFGRIQDVEATAPEELASCVEEVLATSMATNVTTTWTHAVAALDLRAPAVAGVKKLKKKPKRPKRPAALTRVGKICTPVLGGQPDDEVVVVSPMVRSPSGSAGASNLHQVSIRIGPPCTPGGVEVDKASIRREVWGNLGAFAACHAAARDRDPALAGEVTLAWRLSPRSGSADSIVVSGAGDDALHDCLRAALSEVWFQRTGPAVTDVTLPFALASQPAVSDDDPEALLAALDPEPALAIYEQRLNHRPGPAEACRGRADVLTAMVVRAPWLDDARVFGALDDLVAFAQTAPPEVGEACVVAARDTIKGLARRDFHDLAWREPVELYERLRPIVPWLALDENVERRYVESLALIDVARALEHLDGLASGSDGEWAAELAAELREHPDPLALRCGPSQL